MTFEAKFAIQDRVMVDGDTTMVAVVTAVKFGHSSNGPIYEIGWVSNGDPKQTWTEEFRLGAVP